MKQFTLKKAFSILFLLLLSILFSTGCIKQAEDTASWQGIQSGTEDLSAVTDRKEYYDIFVTSKQFDPDASTGTFLGTQFFKGEPVELRAEALPDKNNNYLACLCIYSMNGKREILIPNLRLDASSECYLGQDGSCYSWINSYTIQHDDQEPLIFNTTLTKYLPSGEIQFVKEWNYEESIFDIRQLTDGSVYLILENSDTQKRTLLELDADTGETTEFPETALVKIGLGNQRLGEADNSLALYKTSLLSQAFFPYFSRNF